MRKCIDTLHIAPLRMFQKHCTPGRWDHLIDERILSIELSDHVGSQVSPLRGSRRHFQTLSYMHTHKTYIVL